MNMNLEFSIETGDEDELNLFNKIVTEISKITTIKYMKMEVGEEEEDYEE